MRVLCWGTYDTSKPRTRILIEGLRRNGVEVIERQADIWSGVVDKSQIRGVGRRLWIVLRWLLAYPRLAWQLARAPRPDVILVGFPGLIDMLVAAPIARIRGIPLAWDMFMSVYDTVVEDRRLLRRGGLPARLLHALERFALHRADLVFLDTQAHARRVEALFELPTGSAGAVWVGVEIEHFHAEPATPDAGKGGQSRTTPLKVLFYGQFIPLHGIETIVRAARLTQDADIEWYLIGKGQETARIEKLLAEQPLPRLHWDSWVDYGQLHRRIAEADVCLGIFGTSEKAASVIPNKVFQIVAMGRPLITRDSPAIRELLEDGAPCVQLIPPADPEALAKAVGAIARAHAIAWASCHNALRGKLDPKFVGEQCISLLTNRLRLGS
jgi:glycosyltransferase involved in cell wall biosynthesis